MSSGSDRGAARRFVRRCSAVRMSLLTGYQLEGLHCEEWGTGAKGMFSEKGVLMQSFFQLEHADAAGDELMEHQVAMDARADCIEGFCGAGIISCQD